MPLRSAVRFLSPVFLFAASVALTGCGANLTSGTAGNTVATLHGIAHGGPSPVVGAIVTLYATTSGGYGATATPLGTAITGNDGGFSFVAPLTCTAGQQAYATVQGGNPGSGLNPNYLLMAALGPCSTISSSTVLWIDEVTTVAAAEALRPFTSVTSVGGLYVVNVGAPANNNAAVGTCTVSGTVTTSCVAAGLSHAFENALNLANSVSLGGVNPNGQAYAVTPSNATGVVPQALINSLANSAEACVNSNGGVAGDSSICGNLFTATTPPTTSGVAPTDTLDALLNVAQYPALTSANVTALFGVVPPVAFYQPTLATAPNDYSVALTYTGISTPGSVGTIAVTASGSGYTNVPAVTLSGGGTPTTAATGVASLGIVALNITPNGNTTCTAPTVTFSGGGALNQATAKLTETGGVINGYSISFAGEGYTSVPTATVAGATKCVTGAVVTPVLGVVGIALTNPGAGYNSAPTVAIAGNGTGATATATEGTASIGAPYVEALDANDNVYLGSQDIQGASGDYSFYPALQSNGATLSTTPQNTTYTAPRGLGIDTLGRLWATDNNSMSILEMNPSTGSLINPVYTTTEVPFALTIDKANNVWYGVSQFSELLAATGSTAYTPATFANNGNFANVIRSIAIDQNQNVWASLYHSAGNSGQEVVFANTGTASAPVYGTQTPPYFQGTAFTGNNSIGIAIDASGNAWIGSSTNLYEVTPSGSPISSVTATAIPPANSGVSQPNYDSIDGAGSVWFPNVSGANNLVEYFPGSQISFKYRPCYVANGETACESVNLDMPQHTQVDSTGAVWVTSLGNGRLYQMIGPGTPTWPQLSLSNPGVEPQ